ncbi:hypothetical protein SAMN04488057_10599 [Cyclobacterium lianum]|uniref:Beta-galactosidase trimerisation domain-containing protein n=1 Tax=Cyclobacterium lianum TaxID=388280 RepID=A0A1M7N6U0_9BACT|nr:hypothetical protein [Cyclobacterium lianum]SHM99291.1 hypothetical protein SAMN04488057_10599 [Cyclobacterium lianum]
MNVVCRYWILLLCMLAAGQAKAQNYLKGKPFNNITLEASLKPFKVNEKAYIRAVAHEMFTQWQSLLRHADTVSVMLWTGDGSEILDYKGHPDQPLEWAKYMGNPNTAHEVGAAPESLSLHERAYLYREDPPDFVYADLAFIVQSLKEAGRKVTGKPILVGATFDPGPEFAKSPFKYDKHPEILGGNAMGHKTFVSSYSVLEGDAEAYAGFPEGIPDQTPFGTFFGRQSQHFLSDLGFDYIWFSNGFGFGAEGWSATGAIFSGKEFQEEKLNDATEKVLQFWMLFREECPDFPIQTRGTNLSVGADLARDAVDLKGIYEGGFNMLPPPNSPWAALDGDFGLELAGYMSRMAELPDSRFPFRYYTHDPWWINSPWLDRYGREPHDIYLPMAVGRIDENGQMGVPSHLNFLTIDDTYGNMPTQVPDEVIPHILKARYDLPTAPGPLVWVYPFDEYHDWAKNEDGRLPEVYYGDWFIRQAINAGLPLNTVISTTSFQQAVRKSPGLFNESILLSIAPEEGSAYEQALMEFVKEGGKLIVFGPMDHSAKEFMEFVNLTNKAPLAGEMKLISDGEGNLMDKSGRDLINHRSLFSGGGFRSTMTDPEDQYSRKILHVEQSGDIRDMAWLRTHPDWKGGKVMYFRGTNSSDFTGGRLLTPDDPEEYVIVPGLLRKLLSAFGMHIKVEKRDLSIKDPVLTINRSDKAFIFSGYNPNSTVKQYFKFAQGAPLLIGLETLLEEGYSTYTMPTAWHRECRAFVQQESGMLSFKELHSGQKGISKRYQVSGLENGTLRFYPQEAVSSADLQVFLNSGYPWKNGRVDFEEKNDENGSYFEVENVSGTVVFAW